MQGQVKPNLDWTRNKPAEDLTPFQRFVRDEVDWSQSPLGAPSHWSPQLRQIIQLLVAEPGPAVVYWGEPEDAVIIYNEAYVGIIGSKHPSIQGQLARDGLPEIWDSIYSYLRDQLMTGLMKLGDMQEMMLHRNGFLEESYVSFRLMPILSQEDGTFAGSYATVTEHTLDILAERRSDTIRSLASEIRHATSSSSLWKAVVKGLEKAERDIPLAMLYSAGKADPTQIGEMMCVLESYLGIDPEQPALPRRFGLDSSDYKLAKSFRQAAIHGRPMMFSTGTELLPVDLFATNNSCGHDAHCQSVVICPIKSRESDAIEAFLLIGLNPYRPYDLAYQDFVRMIHESITSLYVSQIMLHEQVEATKLLEAEAALARLTMDKQLAAKQAAFENSELKFSRFGSRIPIGIGIADTKGNVLYGNPAWRRFTQVSETSTKPFDFMACCVPDQDDLIRSLWEDLTQGKPVNSYLRLKTLWTSPDNTQEPMTALINAYTDVDQDGEVSMMSCLTDISHSKWIEAQLLQRTAELEQSELKYKNFADLAPVGVCLLGPDRALQYANRSFFSIMAHPTPSRDFMIGIDPRDAELVHNNLANLKSETTFECRLLRGGQMTNGSAAQRSSNTQAETTQAWILVSAYLEREPTTSIVCWVTDITVQKTMQAVTEQRMKEAIETRRQQERFIGKHPVTLTSTRKLRNVIQT
jgi:PAS domain-containing protein